MAFMTFLLIAEIYFMDVHDSKDNTSSVVIAYRYHL